MMMIFQKLIKGHHILELLFRQEQNMNESVYFVHRRNWI